MKKHRLAAVVILTGVALFSTSLVQAEEAYSCSFEPSTFAVGALVGQGVPAWGQCYRSGTDVSGNITDNHSDPVAGGRQSLLLSGYRSNWLTLGSVTTAPWFEFSVRPSFDETRSGAVAYVKTLRGNIGDLEGINLKLIYATKKVNVNGVDVGDFVNGRWLAVSFRHVVSGGSYSGVFDVYLNGQFKATINAGSSYNGIKTIIFSTAVESGMDPLDSGKVYVDRIHIGDSSVFSSYNPQDRSERHLLGWTYNFQQDYANKVDYFDTEIGVTDIWMDWIQQVWPSTCPNVGFQALIDCGALPALKSRGIRYWFGEHEAFTTMVNHPDDLRNNSTWNSLCFKAKGTYKKAMELGFRGLALDAEDYTGVSQAAWDMYIGPNCDYVDAWCFSDEFGETGKYYTRGKQYGDAIKSVWPDCIVLQLYEACAYAGVPGCRAGNYWWLKGIHDAGLEIWVATERTYGAGYGEMGSAFYQRWLVNMSTYVPYIQGLYPFASRIIPGFFPWDTGAGKPNYLPQYLDQQLDRANDYAYAHWIYTQGLTHGGDPRVTLDRNYCAGFGVTPEDYLACFGRHLTSRAPEISGKASSAKASADYSTVGLEGAVTYASDDFFYVQSKDRSSGIRCVKTGHGLSAGSDAVVTGTLRTLSTGERYIAVTTLTSIPSDMAAPLGMNIRAVGGADFQIGPGGAGQPGVAGGTGLNNIGLLIKTSGKVEFVSPDQKWFTIDDGSGVDLKIVTNASASPVEGDYVTLYGVVSCELSGGSIIPVVLMNEMPTAATPAFYPGGGTYASGTWISVVITCGTFGATIRYTTDGSEPSSTNGTEYVAGSPIHVSTSLVLKAKAWKSGYVESATASAEYVFQAADSIYDCGFDTIDQYVVGNLTGQGTPAWTFGYFYPGGWGEGYESYSVVTAAQAHAGTQSAYVNGYTTARMDLGAVYRPKWAEWAFMTNFAGGGAGGVPERVYMMSTRGVVSDMIGWWFRIHSNDMKLMLSTSTGEVDLGTITDQTWYKVSLEHAFSGSVYSGSYNVYVNGQLKGNYTSPSGESYHGLRNIAFSSAVPSGVSWGECGAMYIDSIHLGNVSVFVQ